VLEESYWKRTLLADGYNFLSARSAASSLWTHKTEVPRTCNGLSSLIDA
jgi:hypothetical protein